MKNYFTQLKENSKKGFSLVELIIVMAIMAILVGVVASQVIPYMEKSRQSKDQQVISALLTDINSAIAQSGEKCGSDGTGGKVTVDQLATATNTKTVSELLELRPGFSDMSALYKDLQDQVKSKAFSGEPITVEVNGTTGEITVFFGSQLNNKNSKSFASTNQNKS